MHTQRADGGVSRRRYTDREKDLEPNVPLNAACESLITFLQITYRCVAVVVEHRRSFVGAFRF